MLLMPRDGSFLLGVHEALQLGGNVACSTHLNVGIDVLKVLIVYVRVVRALVNVQWVVDCHRAALFANSSVAKEDAINGQLASWQQTFDVVKCEGITRDLVDVAAFKSVTRILARDSGSEIQAAALLAVLALCHRLVGPHIWFRRSLVRWSRLHFVELHWLASLLCYRKCLSC